MMTSLMFTAQILGYCFFGFLVVCFLYGFIVGEEGGVEPLRLSDDKSTPLSDQDLYAIATGDEEYLAAHCTLNQNIIDPKVEIQNEKLEIQRLRNKYARMKVEQQIADLQNKPTKKKGVSATQTNPLITECINALVGLGEKKSNARAKVHKYFTDNPNTKTVDQFIAGVFKK